TDDQVAVLARIMVVVIASVSLYLAMYSSATLVSLSLLGYAGVTQFFPGVVLGLFWKRASASGVAVGMAAGIATAAFLMLTNRDPFHGWNAGFVGLCLNFLVTFAVSMMASAARRCVEPALDLNRARVVGQRRA